MQLLENQNEKEEGVGPKLATRKGNASLNQNLL